MSVNFEMRIKAECFDKRLVIEDVLLNISSVELGTFMPGI